MEKYLDASLSARERAKDLLDKLSIEEKMAQVNCMFPFGDNWEDTVDNVRHGIGGVSTLMVREIKSLEEVSAWQRKIQQRVIESSEHGIPAIFHMEGLCGSFIQDSTSYPSGIARGSSWDPELEERIGESVARQELACGITQVLAPVLDISRDSRMGRQGESYGEDPVLSGELGSAYTKGVQNTRLDGRKAESTAKHFLAFHNSQGGIHGAGSDTPERLLEEVYAKPFQMAITKAGLKGIMPSYNSLNGKPVSASKDILTNLLRDEMGFDGICVSDYGAVGNVHQVQRVAENLTDAGFLCMDAGMDMELQCCTCYNDELAKQFEKGERDIQVLDNAVLRILETKFRMGLFENPYALTGEELRKAFFDKDDEKLTLQSALESMVLLKNNGILPISHDVKKIAVIGCHGNNARAFFGGYTHLSMQEAVHAVANSIAGLSAGHTDETKTKMVPGTHIQSDESEEFDNILRQQKPECKSLYEALCDKLPEAEIAYSYGYAIAGDDTSYFKEALKEVQEADIAILTLGGKHGSCSVASMGEGVDATDINLPYCQDAFIKEAAKLGKPLIGIHFNGRPISSDVADKYLDAILEAWNPSEAGGEAIAQTLLGEYNPGGRLPVSVARNAGQIPIYYNHPNGSAWHQGESIGFADYVDMPHTPRYFFGHGLSYTRFDYYDLKLSSQEIAPDDEITISFKVKNIGNRDGDEVAQLYIRDQYASRTRPVMELAGFKRIGLKAGVEKELAFTVRADQMAFLDDEMKWKIEKGKFDLLIGASSDDIRLQDSYCVTDSKYVDGRERGFSAEVLVE